MNIPRRNVKGSRAGAYAAGAAVALFLALVMVALAATVVMAHGADISYSASEGLEITARYDSGDPMAGAQVTVYAPGEPSEPWMTGTCDDSGRFFFAPDRGLPGTWEVRVRQAGHGDMVRIEVGEGGVEAGGNTGFTTLQKVIMALAVVWGFAGTALFFSRRKS